jgi:hypothetical protein
MILHYNSQEYNLLGMFLLLFSYFSYYCESSDLWDLLFIYLLYLSFFSSPNLHVSDIDVFFHGGIYRVFAILSYVTIIVEFVTFNVMWGHISISCLNIHFISPVIGNFMSKVSTMKIMTIKSIYIPRRE